MANPRIEVLPIEEAATPDPSNVNKHTQKGGGLLENSLRKRGAFRSIASAGKGVETPVVYAGNYTLEKAIDAGFTEVVNVHVTGNQIVNVVRDDIEPGTPEAIALGLEDNEIGKQSYNPDIDILAALAAGDNAILSQLKEDDKIFGGMLDGVGIKEETKDAPADVDRAAELLEKWKVSMGDLWAIGSHRLLCGDCTKREDVERVMDCTADIEIHDPPYGMDLDTDYSKMPSTKPEGNKEYESIIGDDKPFDYASIPDLGCRERFMFGADYYAKTLPDGGSWLVWDKRVEDKFDAMIGSAFELIWSKAKHKREFIRCNNTLFSGEAEAKNKLHPTTKPTKVIQWLIEKYGGEVVADFFCGSGTTLVACQNLGRRGRAIEVSPAYVAVTLERMATAFPGIEIKRLQ